MIVNAYQYRQLGLHERNEPTNLIKPNVSTRQVHRKVRQLDAVNDNLRLAIVESRF